MDRHERLLYHQIQAKLARSLVLLASEDAPPQRWPTGADAVETFAKKANELVAQASAHRALSSSLAYDADP